MVRASFRFNSKAVQRTVRRAPEVLERWIRLALNQHGQVYKVEMGKRFGGKLINGRNPSTNRLATRSGALEGSIGFTVGGSSLRSLKLTFHVGNRETIKYAVTQEEGRPGGGKGAIVGKPWLAIPLPAALTGTGRPRIESPKFTKGKPGWFITRTGNNKLLIGKKTASGVEWWWVLKRRVEVPARLGFEKTVNSKKLRQDRIKRIRNGILRGLQEAVG